MGCISSKAAVAPAHMSHVQGVPGEISFKAPDAPLSLEDNDDQFNPPEVDEPKCSSSSRSASSSKRMKALDGRSSGRLSILAHEDPRHNTLQENLVCFRDENITDMYDLPSDRNQVLGTGMSGSVRKIQRKSDGKLFALKTIATDKLNKESLQELQNEITILKTIDNTHIGKLYEAFEDPGVQIHLVLELCTGGELFDRLMEKKTFGEKESAELVYNMLKALHYIHLKNIVHRDLKLENWLFRTRADDADVVLIDFGLSATVKLNKNREEKHLHNKVGTSYYIAPEVLNGDYTSSCDMWSLGVIVYMILSGTAPFGGRDDDEILSNVSKAEYKMDAPVWKTISSEAKDFVSRLLDVNPNTRITAAEALDHAWITQEAQNRPHTEIDGNTLANLRHFKDFHKLKRVAMEVVAFSLDHEEIKNLTDMFEEMDDDHNGFVTFRELKKALRNHKGITDDEIHEIFDALDEEHTGLVHINEFVAASLAEKSYLDDKHLKECFIKMDVERTGFITVDGIKDLLGSCVQEAEALKIIEEAEMFPHEDGDHKVSYQEFAEFMRSDGTQEHYNIHAIKTKESKSDK